MPEMVSNFELAAMVEAEEEVVAVVVVAAALLAWKIGHHFQPETEPNIQFSQLLGAELPLSAAAATHTLHMKNTAQFAKNGPRRGRDRSAEAGAGTSEHTQPYCSVLAHRHSWEQEVGR
jgi:hypothetical protein